MNPVRMEVFRAPDDGSGAAPATPTQIAPSEVSGETSVGGDESLSDAFSGLGGDYDEVPLPPELVGGAATDVIPVPSTPTGAAPPTTPTPTTPTSPQPASTPAPAQSAPPPAAAAPAPAPVSPAETPPSSGTQSAQAAEASLPTDAAGLLEKLNENREAVIDSLAADPRFGLSQEEVTLVETDPAKAIPRLLAKSYFQAVNYTLAQINALVPQMVMRQIKGMELQKKNEGTFYGMFPKLNSEAHGSDVATFANMFKTQNPGLDQKSFFALIGAAVMAKHGLVADAAPPPNGANGAAPKPASPPFTPASPGAVVRTTPVEENPFGGLGQEWPD